MGKATKRWVARCLECLKHKSANQQHGLMHPRFYDKPMNVLGIDFVGPFPKSTNGNRYILTAVCPFSHFLIAIPTPDRSATTAARALFDNVFLKLDFPSTLLSDRGGEFLNDVLCRKFQTCPPLNKCLHLVTDPELMAQRNVFSAS